MPAGLQMVHSLATQRGVPKYGQAHATPVGRPLIICLYAPSPATLIDEPPHRHPLLQSSPRVTLMQSESCAQDVSNMDAVTSMHTPASGGGGEPASLDGLQPLGPHSVHTPFTQSGAPGYGQGHAARLMEAVSASYAASAEVLIGVSPQSHAPEQSVPVGTRVQSAAVAQLRLKLEG